MSPRVKSIDALYTDYFSEYGPYAPLSRVWRQLSMPSADAARKAAGKGTLPIPCLVITGRRGWYVRTHDIATWIEKSRTREAIKTLSELGAPISAGGNDEMSEPNDGHAGRAA